MINDRRCAYSGCGLRFSDHDSWRAGQLTGQMHVFVDPAPQPPADATSDVRYVRCQHGYTDRRCCGTDEDTSPADPHVTGDGDAAVVREVMAQWRQQRENRMSTLTQDLELLARLGIARGREIGARDANAEIKAADYLTESLRDPAVRAAFVEEYKRDYSILEIENAERDGCVAEIDDRIKTMRGGPRLAEAREIRDAIARRAGREGK